MRDKPLEQFVAGGEESYGYLAGDFVRDKDAVISSMKFAEIAAWCKANGRTMWDLLMEVYETCGLYSDQLVSLTLKGIEGMARIRGKMNELREKPPMTLAGVRVVRRIDVLNGTNIDVITGAISPVDLPGSDVLQFVLEDGSRISVRPSGTEPKIKFYLSLRAPFRGQEGYRIQIDDMTKRTLEIRRELGL